MADGTFFERVTVADRGGPHDGRVVDLYVAPDGRLEIDGDRPDGAGRVAVPGLHVGPGWVDIGAGVGEPGFERRETLRSLQAAAVEGGYTRVVAQAATDPAIDDASAVHAFRARAAGHPVDVRPIGALSRDAGGEHLAEYGDLARAGVRFVGDGLEPVDDPKLLQLALAYAEPLGLRVCAQPGQSRLSAGGQVHEGATSTLLGLPGLPAMAEEIGLERDLALLAYRGGRMFVYAPSLATSVDRLREAKAAGLDVSYGVSALHLLLTDEAALGYRPDAKVLPPLRGEADRARLREALASGEADALVSLHRPLTEEETRVEFAYAEFGVATLEHAYGIATTAVGDGLLVADYLGRRNRAAVGEAEVHVADGSGVAADLTFFLPEVDYRVPESPRGSLAANPAAVGETLRGLAVGVCVGGEYLPGAFAASVLATT